MENNIEKSFPFDAKLVGNQYDREYLAEDFARYFRAFISSGLFMEENTSLQVLANNDMTVTLHPGKMVINGYRYDAEAEIIIPIKPADGLLDRIDRIAITWDKEDRNIHYTIREGDFAYEPIAPECRRNAEYKDYVVADVYVAANVVSITQSAITDQRLNGEVCGLAAPFMPFDPTLIFNQLQAFYQETVAENAIWTSEEKQKFEDLMELIKGLLNEDTAAHLQMQMDNKLDKDGDSRDNIVTFESNDTEEDESANGEDEVNSNKYPEGWTHMPLLKSGKHHNALLSRMSIAFKNLRYLGKLLGRTDISKLGDGTVTGALNSLNTNLNGKQDTITGGASTITASNLTANRALISNGSGKVAVSAVTSIQLGYLSGVTSAIQTQFNNISTKLGGASFRYGGNLTNQDVAAWCMNNRREGITIFQCGQGVIPNALQYAMGLAISNGSNRLNIVVFGENHIYTRIINDNSLDNPWKRVAVSSF